MSWFRHRPPAPPRDGSPRVLVAGFDARLGRRLESAVAACGFMTYYAGAPAAAVGLLRHVNPDFLVLDASCGMSLVRATIDAVRRSESDVIALADSEAMRSTCLALGARTALPRDGAPEALVAMLGGGVTPR